jgi:hypothetical protein
VLRHPQERRLSLDTGWRFRLDPQDRGLTERWYAQPEAMRHEIAVPGCWQGQGFGGDGLERLHDFGWRARTLRATYTGTGWYACPFTVPGDWEGERLWLNFGGAHPSAEVWLNGKRLGENDLPFVPFGLEISQAVRRGAQNDLVVRIHEWNRELGATYNWQGNWSGLYRGVELTATGPTDLGRLWLRPEVEGERLSLRGWVADQPPAGAPLVLRLAVSPWGEAGAPLTVEAPVVDGEISYDLPVSAPRLWSPDSPQLYRVETALVQGETVLDARADRVGFVRLSTEGRRFLINGEPYYMRGTGDFLAHPETGSPDTDRERWRRKLRTLRDYGYNFVRCQSYVPAAEYLDVADEVGLLVQTEIGMLGAWGGFSIWHVYQWPQPTADRREALRRQWDRVVERDVHHPSANLYCMSNEWNPSMPYPRLAWDCYRRTKAIKPTAFVLWSDGGSSRRPDLPADYHNDEAEFAEQVEQPLIQHEFRWWSSYPDVRTLAKYTGAVRSYAAELALQAATRHGIAHVLPQAAENSQRLQALEAKAKLEACRRDHPRLAGISHFNAMDTNPSPQGILDEFYERKVTDAETWRETNGDTVILSSLGLADRVLAAGETLRGRFSVSDFSHPPYAAPALAWRLVSGGEVLGTGEVAYAHEPYCTCAAGEMELTLPAVDRPLAARLEVTLREADRQATNRWNVWLFPEAPPLPAGVALYGAPEHTWLRSLEGVPTVSAQELTPGENLRLVLSERLDEALAAFVHADGRVLLAASEGLVRPFQPKLGMENQYFFTPPANYPTYEDGQNGTIISPHPLLGDFPHEGFADLQFFRLIDGCPPLDLEPLGLIGGDPVIRVLHSYPVARPLGYLLEGRWSQGGIILSGLGLEQSRPEARWLLAQICAYGVGEAAAPNLELSASAIEALIRETALP